MSPKNADLSTVCRDRTKKENIFSLKNIKKVKPLDFFLLIEPQKPYMVHVETNISHFAVRLGWLLCIIQVKVMQCMRGGLRTLSHLFQLPSFPSVDCLSATTWAADNSQITSSYFTIRSRACPTPFLSTVTEEVKGGRGASGGGEGKGRYV